MNAGFFWVGTTAVCAHSIQFIEPMWDGVGSQIILAGGACVRTENYSVEELVDMAAAARMANDLVELA